MTPAVPLGRLAAALPGVRAPDADPPITGISFDTRAVRPGHLFVALAGRSADGHALLADAVRAGAAAVVVERAPEADPGVPVVRVPDTRRALAGVAAAWHGHPAGRLRLAGITGTVGKSTTLLMLEAAFGAAARPLGTVGSFGVRVGGAGPETGFTVPDALTLHAAFAGFVRAGCADAAMEVTTHALDQGRVHGLVFDLGVWTNLLPLEHRDYHGSFRAYVEVKRRFLDQLRPRAPLVHRAGDRAVAGLLEGRALRPVSCGAGGAGDVEVRTLAVDAGGTRFLLAPRRPLPGVDAVPPALEVEMRLLGAAAVQNASLAAVAALALGVPGDAVARGLAALSPPRRRLEVVQAGDVTVVDDNAYHPAGVGALFDTVRTLRPRALRVLYGVRGGRGAEVNAHTATALATWLPGFPLARLVVTRCEGSAAPRDLVADAEHAAFLAPLRRAGLPVDEVPRLDDAVERVLDGAGPGDVVLLLGAQGMDRAAELARALLAADPRT